MATLSHIPVLLNECMDGLNIQADGVYIDGTFGRGGHSRKIPNGFMRSNFKNRLHKVASALKRKWLVWAKQPLSLTN